MSITIGILLPESNYIPRIGKDMKRALEAGLKESGLTNYSLVFEPAGYNADAKVVKDKVQSLIHKEEIDILIATLSPPLVEEISTLLESNGVILLLNTLGENPLSDDISSEHIFINSLNLWQSAWLQGYHSVEKFGKRAISIGAIHDVGYNTTKAFTMGLEAAGGHIAAATFTHQQSRTESPLTAIESMLLDESDFFMAYYSGKEAISFIDTWKALDQQKPAITGLYTLYTEDILESHGNALVGQITMGCWDYDSKNEENVSFKHFFEENLGKPAHLYGLLYFESGLLLGNALSQLESTGISDTILIPLLKQATAIGPRGTLRYDPERLEATTTNYVFEIIEEDCQLIRKNTGTVDVPEIYHQHLAAIRNDKNQSGWLNPYLIA